LAYVLVPAPLPDELRLAAEARWTTIVADRPEIGGAVDLQRRLLDLVIGLTQRLERSRLPRLSLPPKYLAAKLAKGVPALAGEPIPLPAALLSDTMTRLCRELAAGGAGDAADHIRTAIESGSLEAASLLSASLSRDQNAIRTGAVHRGLAPDLVWLVAELTVGPFAYILQRTLFAHHAAADPSTAGPLAGALDAWSQGCCPACGSWPAMAEVVSGHRVLRCSFCAMGWELPTYACVYCAEEGEPFVTAAPDEQRKDRRVEVCSGCGSYLKTVDAFTLSPFPLLSIADLETMDLDMAAMEHGYQRPPLREFAIKR
jgi:FdhE protein